MTATAIVQPCPSGQPVQWLPPVDTVRDAAGALVFDGETFVAVVCAGFGRASASPTVGPVVAMRLGVGDADGAMADADGSGPGSGATTARTGGRSCAFESPSGRDSVTATPMAATNASATAAGSQRVRAPSGRRSGATGGAGSGVTGGAGSRCRWRPWRRRMMAATLPRQDHTGERDGAEVVRVGVLVVAGVALRVGVVLFTGVVVAGADVTGVALRSPSGAGGSSRATGASRAPQLGLRQ